MHKFNIKEEKKLTVEDSCRLFNRIADTVGGKPIMDSNTRKDIIKFSELYNPGGNWTAHVAFEFGYEEAMAATKSQNKETAYEGWAAIYQAALGLYPKAHACQKSKNYVDNNFNFELAKSLAESRNAEDNRRIASWVMISQQAKKNQHAKQYFLQYFSKLTEEEKSSIKNALSQQAPASQSKPRP